MPTIPSAALRTVPPELAGRYEAKGWWTRETLGDLLTDGLGRAGGVEFPRTPSGKVKKFVLRKYIATPSK